MLPFKVVSPAQRAKGWPWGGPMGPWARLTAYIVAFTTPFHGSHLMLLPMISGGRIQALAACIWAHNVRWTQLEQIRQHFLVLIPLGWITSSIFWIKMSWRIATSHWRMTPSVLIPGFPRTGSTFLATALMQHPAVAPNHGINHNKETFAFGGLPGLLRWLPVSAWYHLKKPGLITFDGTPSYIFNLPDVYPRICRLPAPLQPKKHLVIVRPYLDTIHSHICYFTPEWIHKPMARYLSTAASWNTEKLRTTLASFRDQKVSTSWAQLITDVYGTMYQGLLSEEERMHTTLAFYCALCEQHRYTKRWLDAFGVDKVPPHPPPPHPPADDQRSQLFPAGAHNPHGRPFRRHADHHRCGVRLSRAATLRSGPCAGQTQRSANVFQQPQV